MTCQQPHWCCALASVYVGVEGSTEAIAPKPRISQGEKQEPQRGSELQQSLRVGQGPWGGLPGQGLFPLLTPAEYPNDCLIPLSQ